jgi:hypothetical protein
MKMMGGMKRNAWVDDALKCWLRFKVSCLQNFLTLLSRNINFL